MSIGAFPLAAAFLSLSIIIVIIIIIQPAGKTIESILGGFATRCGDGGNHSSECST